MNFGFEMASHVGKKRKTNQDKLLIRIGEAKPVGEFGLFAVADGMGGMAEGGKASQLAINALKKWWDQLTPDFIGESGLQKIAWELPAQFREINSCIRNYGSSLGSRMGTTLSVLFAACNFFVLCHIGDSRIYRLTRNNGSLIQISEDHTVAAQEVRMGALSEEDALRYPSRNCLTQCLGVKGSVEPYTISGKMANDDIFILCSDGLYSQVSPGLLAETVLEKQPSWRTDSGLAQRLIQIANDNGGKDNSSVIVLWNNPDVIKGSILAKLKGLTKYGLFC